MKLFIDYKKGINWFIEIFIQYVPAFLLFLFLLISVFSKKYTLISNLYDTIYNFLNNKLFCASRLEMLSTISIVLIGFYVTIISVFGSSYSEAIIKISKNGYGTKFMGYATSAVVSSFLHFILTIFLDIVNGRFIMFLYTTTFTWLICSFVRFSFIVLSMYNLNIKEAVSFVENEENHRKEIVTLLKEIKNNNDIVKIRNDHIRFSKYKEINELQLKEGKDPNT